MNSKESQSQGKKRVERSKNTTQMGTGSGKRTQKVQDIDKNGIDMDETEDWGFEKRAQVVT